MERKLTAIFCADVYGYSRLTGEDEEATHRTLRSYRKLIDGLIEQHHGRFVHSAGDSVLAEFMSVVKATQCAVEIQTALKAENARLPVERRMEFRIGINLGDVIVDGVEIYGDGVNVAARLESLADPGAIFISGSVREQLGNKLPLGYTDLGERSVKNIAHPVRVFRVLLDGAAPTPRIARKYVRPAVLSVTGLAIVVATILLVQHVSLRPQSTHASIPPLEKPALPLPDIPSIAVLPFTNLSGDPRQEYFSDGIAAQLIDSLSRLPGLFVIARNSSFAYKGKATKESEIGKELGVRYVLEGNVSKETDQVRIGVELVDASSETDEWTAQYNRPLKDIFAVQDEIVGRVVTTLGLLLKLDEMKLPHAGNEQPTQNLEAFDDLLRATENVWRATKEDNAKGREWAERAIKLDPKFAQAYALLGWTYLDDAWDQWSENPMADLERSMTEARKALALDDSNVNALALVSDLDWMQCQFDQAVTDGQRAVSINPNYAQGYLALSDALVNDRKPEAALRAAEKAMRLDPASRDFYAYAAGNAYNQLGSYQEAVHLLKGSATAHPNLLVAHLALIGPYLELGRDQDARAEAAEVMRISPQFVVPPPTTCWTKDIAWNKHMQDQLRKAGLK